MVDWTRLFFCLPRTRTGAAGNTPDAPQPPNVQNDIPLSPIARPPRAHIEDGPSRRESLPPRQRPPSLEALRGEDRLRPDDSASGAQNLDASATSSAEPPRVDTNWLSAVPVRRRTDPAADASNPVAAVNGHRLTRVIQAFRQNMEELKPSPDQEAGWQERLQHTHHMMDNLDVVSSWPKTDGLVYVFEGIPVGVMVVAPNQDDTRLSVHAFVTHPLSEGVGVSLGEAAVNHSQACGKGGRLDGLPLSEGVKQLYLAMGCRPEGDRLVLDPAKSDKWEMAEGRWRMKKYAGTLSHADIASMNQAVSEKAALKGRT